MMRSRRGFSLIGAIWLLALISGLSLEIALSARHSRLAIANGFEKDLACVWAEAGAAEARASLVAQLEIVKSNPLAQRSALRVLPLNRPQADGANGLTHSVHLHDATSRLNINVADAVTIRRLLAALSIDDGAADAVSQALLDWRDPDDLPRLRGAEADEYIAAGLPVLPTNSDFPDGESIRRVIGVSPRVLNALLPFITTRGSGRININSAPRAVLASVQGFDARVLARIETLQSSGVLISSPDHFLAAMPAADRSALLDSRTEWEPRVVFDFSEVSVDVVVTDASGRTRCEISGLFVRVGSDVLLTQREIQ